MGDNQPDSDVVGTPAGSGMEIPSEEVPSKFIRENIVNASLPTEQLRQYSADLKTSASNSNDSSENVETVC